MYYFYKNKALRAWRKTHLLAYSTATGVRSPYMLSSGFIVFEANDIGYLHMQSSNYCTCIDHVQDTAR